MSERLQEELRRMDEEYETAYETCATAVNSVDLVKSTYVMIANDDDDDGGGGDDNDDDGDGDEHTWPRVQASNT